MCGVAGFWSPASFDVDRATATLRAMTDRIRSRGPDSEGHWLDSSRGIALGHRRLSILELTPAGAQPMISASGRYVIVFNGEIYNHLAIRDELARGEPFRGHSDTETLLRAFDAWGIERALATAVGMFALACWDRKLGELVLARDRMGEKPLYYGWQGSGVGRTFLFGSELKAITCHPAFEGRVDRSSVAGYLERLCVPGERSIWEGVGKVPPGTIMRFSEAEPEGRQARYWSLGEAVAAAKRNPVEAPDDALELIHDRLAEAVRGQLLSDVPLGAFLSGGIDSTLVVALMQEVGDGRSETFSIGFEDAAYNEADHARAVARHLGTDHHELVLSAARAREIIPRLPLIYDEPFADSSQIPTFLVSEMASQQVTVALSGDGADELFVGYTRYAKALLAWKRVSAVPQALRSLTSTVTATASDVLPRRIVRTSAIARATNLVDFYRNFTDHALADRPRSAPFDMPLDIASLSPAEQLMAVDQITYLPDDILVKVDRAAMAVSLEVRAPFLDHRVVEASWRLPSSLKRHEEEGATVGKWPLRRLLDRYVPRTLMERPKQGFAIPVGGWLRGPLRAWADDLLARERLERMDLVDPRAVSSLWEAHRSGRADHAEKVWALAMLSAWHQEQADSRAPACVA
jgi:asparagine synthase (glutamine-hydrolysing)